MIENLTNLFLWEVAPDLNITGILGLFGQETEQFLNETTWWIYHTNSNLLKDLWVAQKFAAAF